jgi:hypothetical protein
MRREDLAGACSAITRYFSRKGRKDAKNAKVRGKGEERREIGVVVQRVRY